MSAVRPFAELLVWRDPVPRPGPECMALDEVLLRGLGRAPVLRFYEWDGAWASVGYFGDVEAARAELGPGVPVVRRWTGGGVVDHRDDLTYSLMVPAAHGVAKLRRLEAYRVIHEAVVAALAEGGVKAELISEDAAGDSIHCFRKPVAWDVVDATGRKLAGAGQRRTRFGLLHQGSVAAPSGGLALDAFGPALAGHLASADYDWQPGEALIDRARKLAQEKYGRDGSR